MMRREWDEGARQVRTWVDGVEQDPRPFDDDENAVVDATTTTRTRETRYTTLLDRAEAAQQGNRDARATLADIAGASSFNNTQRDNALRFLAGRVDALTVQNNAIMQLVLRLAGRAASMDSPD